MENSSRFRIVWLDKVASTNDYASSVESDPSSHGLVIVADYQSEGRGQRGSRWESKKGENLLFSIVLHPTWLKVKHQFLLSKLIAVSVCSTLANSVDNVSIKWPNDIYIGSKKVGGILIENSFSGATLDSSIIGVGINVNQTEFDITLPNPTSLQLETDKFIDKKELLDSICIIFWENYSLLSKGQVEQVNSNYFVNLFRRDGFHPYFADGKNFVAKILGVRNSGELLLETEDGLVREFYFKEVEFLL
jgi:BirA family transcriptional regulator, biotin operon repressor / biotin---[acetyl-CoA-carboxylase] ligase